MIPEIKNFSVKKNSLKTFKRHIKSLLKSALLRSRSFEREEHTFLKTRRCVEFKHTLQTEGYLSLINDIDH
jgi:hypothetical protein